MTNDDRKAFEAWWADVLDGDPGMKFARQNGGIDTVDGRDWIKTACKISYLAARDHYRQQVAELVEAVENMHPEDAASCRLWDRVRQAKHLAAKLKEQQ